MPLRVLNNIFKIVTVITFLVMFSCHTHHEIVKTTDAAIPQKHDVTYYDKLNKKSPEGVKTNNSLPERKATYRNGAIIEKYAVKLGVNKDELKSARLYTLIDEWYATPYKWGGRTKAGIDCSDFTEVVLEKIYGISITGPASSIFKQCNIIPKTDLREGDLVFFNISGPLSHVGVYLCNNKFVHASVRAGVVIEDLNLDYYKRYFYKAARIKKS